MQKIYILMMSALIPVLTFSQNENDLFRFSRTTFQGDARFEAMAGSFGGLGANFGSSQINPAGFARYSSSQFGSAFSVTNQKNTATFYGTRADTSRTSFKMTNLAVVFVNDASENSNGFIYTQFGLGYNRIDNFTYRTKYEGQLFNSLLDGFGAAGEGISPEFLLQSRPFTTHLAYESFTIGDYDPSTGTYPSLLTSGDMYHNRSIINKGGINEFFISFSGNYLNRLYLGGNIGIRSFNFSERIEHNEILLDTAGTDLRGFDYEYNLETQGTGGNIKLGFIYLPTNNSRIGLAYHSPTFVEMDDEFSADMTGRFNYGDQLIPESLKPTGSYTYKVRTPGRIVGSLAYIFNTVACLNIDVEYVDYRHAKFKGVEKENNPFYNFKQENEAAKALFQSAFNFRIGGEVNISSILFLRGGYAYYPSTFKQSVNAELDNQHIYTGGFGIKSGNFTLDLAYKTTSYSRKYYAFEGSEAEINSRINSFILSFNVIF